MTGNIVMMSIIYILVIVLLIVLIILGIKAIFTVDSLNKNLNEINTKIHSFDSLFEFFEGLGYTLSTLNNKFISKIDYVLKIFSKFRKGDKNE